MEKASESSKDRLDIPDNSKIYEDLEKLATCIGDNKMAEFSALFLDAVEKNAKYLHFLFEDNPNYSKEKKNRIINNYLLEIDKIAETFCEDSEDLSDLKKSLNEDVLKLWLDRLVQDPDSHFFTVDSMSLDSRLRQILFMTQYGGSKRRVTGWDAFKHKEEIGGYHIYNTDVESLHEATDTTSKISKIKGIPALTSYDFEGGVVRPIRLTESELNQYDIPVRFRDLIRQKKQPPSWWRHIKKVVDIELLNNLVSKEGLVFPSAEEIGNLYREIKNNSVEKDKFLKDYTQYGACIAKICKDAGISINFAPNIDLVPDVESTEHILAREGRAYSHNSDDIIELAGAFIDGFQSISGTSLIPKHYFGVGYVDKNLHEGIAEFMKDEKDPKKREEAVKKIQTVFDALLGRVSGVMSSHVIMEEFNQGGNRPITVSKQSIDRLRSRGFKGLLISDDLNMESMNLRYPNDFYTLYYRSKEGVKHSFEVSSAAMRVIETVAAGHDMVLYMDEIDKLDEIIDALKKMIMYEVDQDEDGTADITEHKINKSVRKIMEFKHQTGLIEKVEVQGDSYFYY